MKMSPKQGQIILIHQSGVITGCPASVLSELLKVSSIVYLVAQNNFGSLIIHSQATQQNIVLQSYLIPATEYNILIQHKYCKYMTLP